MERGLDLYSPKFSHHGSCSKAREWHSFVNAGHVHHFTLGFWGGAEQYSGDWEGDRYGLIPHWCWGMRGMAEVKTRPLRRLESVKKCIVR